jgi:hypothetical protein
MKTPPAPQTISPYDAILDVVQALLLVAVRNVNDVRARSEPEPSTDVWKALANMHVVNVTRPSDRRHVVVQCDNGICYAIQVRLLGAPR